MEVDENLKYTGSLFLFVGKSMNTNTENEYVFI